MIIISLEFEQFAHIRWQCSQSIDAHTKKLTERNEIAKHQMQNEFRANARGENYGVFFSLIFVAHQLPTVDRAVCA